MDDSRLKHSEERRGHVAVDTRLKTEGHADVATWRVGSAKAGGSAECFYVREVSEQV